MKSPDPIPERELVLKAERYCAYRERSRREVLEKLRELGAEPDTAERIVRSLEENEFLNDARFARMFASGKFRIKRWGKNKIRGELKMKGIPEAMITAALNDLDGTDYEKTIRQLIEKKDKELRKEKPLVRKQKLVRFLMSKGYEYGLIMEVLGRKS